MELEYLGYIIIPLFNLGALVSCIILILVGKNIIKHPMYDTDAKKKFCLISGIIGVILLTISQVFFSIPLFYIIIDLIKS